MNAASDLCLRRASGDPGFPAAIAAYGVDIWLARPRPAPALCAWAAASLSEDERRRCARARDASGRERRLLARFVLRTVLARYLGGEPAAVPLVAGGHGKPSLACDGPAFSLSRCGRLVAVAVAGGDRALGLDIEIRGRRDLARLPMRALADSEIATLPPRSGRAREECFLRYWTAKEAYTKGLGVGLALDPRAVEIRQAGTGVELCGPASRSWRLAHFHAPRGVVGAIAVRGRRRP